MDSRLYFVIGDLAANVLVEVPADGLAPTPA